MASVITTNKKQGEAADGTGTWIGTCLINRWRARISQEGLYNVKTDAPKREGAEKKKAKNQSLPDRTEEIDFSSEHGLVLYQYHD